MFVDLLRRALTKFNLDNIETVTVVGLAEKDFLVIYYVRGFPSVEDRQTMENIRNKILADPYKCVDQFKYHWRRMSGGKFPRISDGEMVVYDKKESMYGEKPHIEWDLPVFYQRL